MTDTRQALVEGVTECIREGGVGAASSRAIAAAAGVNLGAITYHFGSKDDLVAEALLTTIRGAFEPALSALRRDDLEPAVRVGMAVEALRGTFRAQAADAPAYVEALVQARHLPALREGLFELAGELRRFLSEQIAAQQEAGQLPAWIDPAPMATLILAVLNGTVMQAVLDPEGTDVDAVAAQFAALLLAVATGPWRPVAEG
ncbi:MAG: TetR/AcrR family transcriptional regulator [Acidimicrobiia bacterium]